MTSTPDHMERLAQTELNETLKWVREQRIAKGIDPDNPKRKLDGRQLLALATAERAGRSEPPSFTTVVARACRLRGTR